MRPVAVIGVGKTPFGAFPDRDLRSLAVEAGEKCLRNANVTPGADRVVLPRQFRRTVIRRPESSGAICLDRAEYLRCAGHPRRGRLCVERFGVLPRVGGSRGGDLRRRDGGRGREDDVPAHRADQRDSGSGGRLLGRDASGKHLRVAVRHDRAAPHAPVRDEAGASGRGRGQESRQRRAQSRRAHA